MTRDDWRDRVRDLLPDEPVREDDPSLIFNLTPMDQQLAGEIYEEELHSMWMINHGRRLAMEHRDLHLSGQAAPRLQDTKPYSGSTGEDLVYPYADAIADLLAAATHEGLDPKDVLTSAWKSRGANLSMTLESCLDRLVTRSDT